jgi:SRSO17 transposase
MDVPASPAALPEWQACLGAFQVRFRRPEGREALERDTTGQLTELPNKNSDPIAQAVPGTWAQRLQEVLTNMPWDEEDLNRQRVQKMVAEAAGGEGCWCSTRRAFPSRGRRRWGGRDSSRGPWARWANGQMVVTCCYSDPQATWPVAVQLYLPKTWAYDPQRRQQTRVPEEIPFRTKPEMALMLLDEARAGGVPHRCVVADADEGDHPNVLAGLEARQEPSVVAVRTDFVVKLRHAATSRLWRADEWLQTVPRWPWRTMRWRQGTTGWLRKTCVAGRCGRVTRDGSRHEGWLVGDRAPRGPPEERTDVWSHLPAETRLEALAGLAHWRHAIERFHEEATGEPGWDQYQGCLWPGFHRHAVTVMLAYSVLSGLDQRPRQRHTRQGRLRDPFSPSADVPGARPCRRCLVRWPCGGGTRPYGGG